MITALRSVAALLLGAAILFVGNGLQGLVVPVRGELEGFPTPVIGLLSSSWSIGFVAGCLLVPRMVGRVGHIRSFAVLAAAAASVALLLVLVVHPGAWIALRAVTGFSFAGLFMVIESWLNERASNDTRGQVFAVYMIVNLVAVTAGQMLLPLAEPAGFVPFALMALLITLSLVPVGLTTAVAPAPLRETRLRLTRLYRLSPVGLVGCVFVGAANGSFGGLGPLYAQEAGLSLGGVAVFMSAILVGGALGQMPFGRLSDRVDRRRVMLVCCAVCVAVGMVLAAAGGAGPSALDRFAGLDTAPLILLALALGFGAYPLYALCVAHTNDYIPAEDFVEASSGLLLAYGLGNVAGPLVASLLMPLLGHGALFLFTAAVHAAFAAFALYRMTRRTALPAEERDAFAGQHAHPTTPVATELDPRGFDEAATVD